MLHYITGLVSVLCVRMDWAPSYGGAAFGLSRLGHRDAVKHDAPHEHPGSENIGTFLFTFYYSFRIKTRRVLSDRNFWARNQPERAAHPTAACFLTEPLLLQVTGIFKKTPSPGLCHTGTTGDRVTERFSIEKAVISP